MNETLKTIANRYSCRRFTDRAVPDADLRAIAEAAVQSPSGMNRQFWRIAVVKNKRLLDDMDAEGMRVMSELPDKAMYEHLLSRGGKLFYNARSMVFIAIKEAYPKGAELIDLGIVAQTVCLAATSLGVDNCQCGFTAFCFAGGRAQEFKTRLKLPEGYECGLGVLLGYAGEQGKPHAPDKAKITFIE
jgi:nitroreductase